MNQNRTMFHPSHNVLPDPALRPKETALLVVDMQYLDAHPDYGMVARLKAEGRDESFRYYTDRLRLIVPNIKRLLSEFRERRMEVIYTVIESLTRDGRERSLEHKRMGLLAPAGSKEGQVLEEIAPAGDEIVLKKTCGSVFNGTILDYALRNLGIRTLVICGVVTSGCVESAVRDASNLSYEVVVPEDACATWTPALHEAAVYMLGIYGKVYSTAETLRRLDEASAAPAVSRRP